MSQDNNGLNVPLGKITKKMSKKGTNQIPLDILGFRSKVIYDSTYQYVPRKKYNKYSKFQKEKRQQNFRSRLSCVIDPSHATHQDIGDMTFNKRAEWKKINYIIFKTKQQLYCCICLNKKFVASQMTFCGHVFCWHCILMHYEKSLKATSCPVCNQVFEIQQLKTCISLYQPPVNQGDSIKLKLRTRVLGQKVIFDPQTLQQQIDLSHIVRMKCNNILQKFDNQHQQILNQMKRNQDSQSQKYLQKVLQKNQKKIQQLKKIISQEKGYHFKPHKHQTVINGVVYRNLVYQQIPNEKLATFYQQEEGRYVYLHPICEKYLIRNFQSDYLPLRIEAEVLMKEETQYSNENIKKYKYLNHLPQNQDFDFVFIRMNELIDYRLLQQFEKQFEQYKKKKQQILSRQELEANIRNQKYEKQKQYLKKLKKMEQSQFHDIIIPTNMVDLSLIKDQNIFPSLVQTSSQSQSNNSSYLSEKVKQNSIESSVNKKGKKQNKNFAINEDDFPGLQLSIKQSLQDSFKSLQTQENIKRVLSDSPTKLKQYQEQQSKEKINKVQKNDFPSFSQKYSQNIQPKKRKIDDQNQKQSIKEKGKKKKKEKFIDVTHQFFQGNQEDEF